MTNSVTFVDQATVIQAAWCNDINRSEYVDTFNVKDYGAVGDNVTDDTTAIAACFTAAAAVTISENSTTIAKGARVYFPPGVYVVSSALNVPARCYVQGAGQGGVLSSIENSPGVSVIRGTHNGIILNCIQDRFTLSSLGISGPNNPAYTASVGIQTASVLPQGGYTVSGALSFTMAHLFVENCYNNIIIQSSYDGNLLDVTSQAANGGCGIRARNAQGQWLQTSVLANAGHGVIIETHTDINGHISGNAAPDICMFQTWNNGGSGVCVTDTKQGLTIDTFFINNDAQGGVTFNDKASLDQTLSGSLTNGNIQYCGNTSWAGADKNARGVYIGANVGRVDLVSVSFFSNAGNHVEHHGSTLSIMGGQMVGAGQGSVINGVYTAPILPGDQYCVYSTSIGHLVMMTNVQTNDPILLGGNYNQICNCYIATDYAKTNDHGTSRQQVPTFSLGGTSAYNVLTGNIMTQVNSGSSGSARCFVGGAGTSYTMRGNQCFVANGASNDNLGALQTPYLG